MIATDEQIEALEQTDLDETVRSLIERIRHEQKENDRLGLRLVELSKELRHRAFTREQTFYYVDKVVALQKTVDSVSAVLAQSQQSLLEILRAMKDATTERDKLVDCVRHVLNYTSANGDHPIYPRHLLDGMREVLAEIDGRGGWGIDRPKKAIGASE